MTGGVFAATCRHGAVYATKVMPGYETLALPYQFLVSRVFGAKIKHARSSPQSVAECVTTALCQGKVTV